MMYIQNISQQDVFIKSRKPGVGDILLKPGCIIDSTKHMNINVYQAVQLEDEGKVEILGRSQVEKIVKLVRKRDIDRFELMDMEE